MHITKSSSTIRRLSRGLALTLAALSLTAAASTGTAQASEDAVPTRAQVVAAAIWNLDNPRPFKTSSTSAVYNSTPHTTSPRYNLLSRNGSNANRNIYNTYNGEEWCGYFVRFMWTLGGADSNPAVPSGYPSSQAWRTGVGSRFHSYSSGGSLPQAGDALVWSNDGDSAQGHVAIVTYVDTAKRTLSWIGGNEWGDGSKDAVIYHTGYWSNMETAMSGKDFRGFASY